MRIASKASRTAFLAATTAAVVLVAALSGEGVSATTLASGKPLQVAEESYEGKTQEVARPPLSAGIVTRPLGAGNVFGGKLPDIFVANTKESTHPASSSFSTFPRTRRDPKSSSGGSSSPTPSRASSRPPATSSSTTARSTGSSSSRATSWPTRFTTGTLTVSWAGARCTSWACRGRRPPSSTSPTATTGATSCSRFPTG